MALGFGDAHGAGVTDGGKVFTWGVGAAGPEGQAPTGAAAVAAAAQPEQLAVLRGLEVKALACGAEVRGLQVRLLFPREQASTSVVNLWRRRSPRSRRFCAVLIAPACSTDVGVA